MQKPEMKQRGFKSSWRCLICNNDWVAVYYHANHTATYKYWLKIEFILSTNDMVHSNDLLYIATIWYT